MSYIITDTAPLKVSVKNFSDLFLTGHYQMVIPEYQRPYVWSKGKVRELLNDLLDFFKTDTELSYYMGTLLFHQKDKESSISIIDGQQRISTILVLYYCLNGENSFNDFCRQSNLTYNSPISKRNLQKAKAAIDSFSGLDTIKSIKSLFRLLNFTVIVTKSEDDAFTFFETSNNRGIKLSATDFLKAYHLREINNTYEELQHTCARKWEKIESLKNSVSGSHDYIEILFNTLLWRSRSWRGKRVDFENQDYILKEFQKKTIPTDCVDRIALYPNRKNMLATHLQLKDDIGYKLHGANIVFQGKSSDFPFLLRQPISKGLNFFLYAEKYAELVHELFNGSSHKNSEIKEIQNFYRAVYRHTSLYLKELFILCICMYYDKFHTEKIVQFAYLLDYAIGAIRLEKKYVFKQATIKFFRDSSLNLLDIIDQAYIPDEVLAYFENNEAINNVYIQNFNDLGNGVQGRYLQSILAYFMKDISEVKERRLWTR
jgi:hypothetical protein